MRTHLSPPCRRHLPRRRGVITIWTVICLPLLLILLLAVAEVGRLWHARVQLENALEAAALAAVQQWGDLGGGAKNVPAAFAAGRAYGEANAVHGVSVRLGDRRIVPSVACSFGTAAPNGTGYDFTPAPDATTRLAVVLEGTIKVARLCRPILGASLGEATVTASTVAYYEPGETPRRPRLIRLHDDR